MQKQPMTLLEVCQAGGHLAQMFKSGSPALAELAGVLSIELRLVHGRDVLPEWKEAVQKEREQRRGEQKAKMLRDGPVLWAEWHQRARDWKEGNDLEFIKSVMDRLPCGNCKRGFRVLISEHPPKFEEPGFDYFAYTVDIHNRVSAKLDPPHSPLTLEEARERWA